jgi:hypothetical protein
VELEPDGELRLDGRSLEPAGRAFEWTWPPQLGDAGGPEKIVPGEWGAVYLMPATETEPADVMIKFHPQSIEARRKAFAFAQALATKLMGLLPGANIEFYVADDHYHVVVEDFGSDERRLAAGFVDAFGRGALSGRRNGRRRSPDLC